MGLFICSQAKSIKDPALITHPNFLKALANISPFSPQSYEQGKASLAWFTEEKTKERKRVQNSFKITELVRGRGPGTLGSCFPRGRLSLPIPKKHQESEQMGNQSFLPIKTLSFLGLCGLCGLCRLEPHTSFFIWNPQHSAVPP